MIMTGSNGWLVVVVSDKLANDKLANEGCIVVQKHHLSELKTLIKETDCRVIMTVPLHEALKSSNATVYYDVDNLIPSTGGGKL